MPAPMVVVAIPAVAVIPGVVMPACLLVFVQCMPSMTTKDGFFSRSRLLERIFF